MLQVQTNMRPMTRVVCWCRKEENSRGEREQSQGTQGRRRQGGGGGPQGRGAGCREANAAVGASRRRRSRRPRRPASGVIRGAHRVACANCPLTSCAAKARPLDYGSVSTCTADWRLIWYDAAGVAQESVGKAVPDAMPTKEMTEQAAAKSDEELARERMSQWVKSDDAAPLAEDSSAAGSEAAEDSEAEEAGSAYEVQVPYTCSIPWTHRFPRPHCWRGHFSCVGVLSPLQPAFCVWPKLLL